MTPKQMLENLNDAGDESGSDLHDGLDGYFGWHIEGDLLSVWFEPADDSTEDRTTWRLLPISEDGEFPA